MPTINIRFPLVDDPSTNTFFQMTETTKNALKSDLLLLLLTQKGERYYEPNYGTNLIKFIFEPNDGITATEVEQEIKRTVSLYIPTLTIDRVSFNWETDEDGFKIPDTQLNVNIRFTYSEDAFSEGGELDINF
jgi:phage baseplate assembly protein W